MIDIEFADRYVDPILSGEKTATVRYRPSTGYFPGADARFRDEAGTVFAIGTIERVATVPVSKALEVATALGGDHGADGPGDLLDGLGRHYPEADLGLHSMVVVVVFDATPAPGHRKRARQGDPEE